MTPQQSIERESARRGRTEVITGCRALVRGEQVDPDLLVALGGPAARKFLDGAVHDDTYWLRVWGARGLLWVWDDTAKADIILAIRDPAWRVREMGLKVVARHLMGDLVSEVAEARHDPVPRVRQAADRALTVLTASGE
jgi:HEAT repeat protein